MFLYDITNIRNIRGEVKHYALYFTVLFTKNNGFSAKTIAHIHRLFVEFGFDEAFGRSAVMELLALKGSGASKLLSNLVQADIIRPVPGYGKGKYKFKKVI